MRALFIASPGVGHAFPMVPLAWALRADGHEVLVATAADGLAVAQAGLPVVDLLPGLDRRARADPYRQERRCPAPCRGRRGARTGAVAV